MGLLAISHCSEGHHGDHKTLFLFRSSLGPNGSSSSRSAVSAGFSRLCTLLAILLRLVAGAEESRYCTLPGNLPLACDQLLSMLKVLGVVSLLVVKGGVV